MILHNKLLSVVDKNIVSSTKTVYCFIKQYNLKYNNFIKGNRTEALQAFISHILKGLNQINP